MVRPEGWLRSRVVLTQRSSVHTSRAYSSTCHSSLGSGLVAARPGSLPRGRRPRPPFSRPRVRTRTPPLRSSLLGDSLTDVEAAHRAGVGSIAFANKPDERKALLAAQPGALVSSGVVMSGRGCNDNDATVETVGTTTTARMSEERACSIGDGMQLRA